MLWSEPVTLVGAHVRLEPAGPEHVDALWAAAQDPAIWRYIPFPVGSRDDMACVTTCTACWIAEKRARQRRGKTTGVTISSVATVISTSGRPRRAKSQKR